MIASIEQLLTEINQDRILKSNNAATRRSRWSKAEESLLAQVFPSKFSLSFASERTTRCWETSSLAKLPAKSARSSGSYSKAARRLCWKWRKNCTVTNAKTTLTVYLNHHRVHRYDYDHDRHLPAAPLLLKLTRVNSSKQPNYQACLIISPKV